jgi:phosphoserine/homoserine phosphotransferase
LFKSTAKIKAEHPELPAYEEFGDLLHAIKAAMT